MNWLLLEDGSGHLELEDATGALLLEDSVSVTAEWLTRARRRGRR